MAHQQISRGQPSQLKLSSLILLSPESALKLDDLSMRGLFEQSGQESLYKGIQRALRLRVSQIIPRSLKKFLVENLLKQPTGFANTFLRACDGDPVAVHQLDKLGFWGAFRIGCDGAEKSELILIDQCVEVEATCFDIDTCLAEQRWVDAANLARSNPVIRPYLTDAALEALADAKTLDETLPPRFAGVLELLLSQIALVDQSLTTRDSKFEGFEHLLNSGSVDKIKPGRGFIHWLMRRLDVNSLPRLLERDTRKSQLDDSTLKRWSSGAEFPSEDSARRFVEAILPKKSEEGHDALWHQSATQYWAARRLHKTLVLAEILFSAASETSSWGTRLLGTKGAAQWARQRYGGWREHWRHFEIDQANAK